MHVLRYDYKKKNKINSNYEGHHDLWRGIEKSLKRMMTLSLKVVCMGSSKPS
jgi:hypothetical protein